VVNFASEEKYFTNSIPKLIASITLQKAWGNKG